MSLDKSLSCASGEYLVLGEMLRRGYECYLANGPTQKGWDIIILNETSKPIKIQVKTIDWPEENAINGKLDKGYDILVVVLLQHNEPHVKFVISSCEEIVPLLSPVNNDEKTERGKYGGNMRTLNIGKNFEKDTKKKTLKVDEVAWEYLKELLKQLTNQKGKDTIP